MTREELFDLTNKLYQSSLLMKNINEECADALLQMSSEVLVLLERVNIPEDVQKEIDEIKSELLSD